MKSSQNMPVDVEVTLEPYLLRKVEQVAAEKNISIPEALIYLLTVASHQN